MKIKTRCNHCGKVYQMAAEYIGKTAQCKQCHNNFLMVALEEAPPAPQPATQPPFDFAPADTMASPSDPFGGMPPAGGPAANPFGAPPQAGAPAANPFGAPPQAGAPAANPFGAPPQAGAPAANPFGAPPQAGAPAANPFGAPPQPGAPAQNPFGAAPGQPAAPPQMGAMPGQSYAASPPPPGPSPSQFNTQTVVCPKCKFTADIPPVSGKLHLRCQECGHKFAVKPESKKGGGRANPASDYNASEKKGLPKAAILGLLVVLLLAAVVFVGPTLLPDIIPNLLP